MKRSRKTNGSKGNHLVWAFAKLAFYFAVAVFTKNQFEEMGKSPAEPSNNIEQLTGQSQLPKHEPSNPKTAKRTALLVSTKLNNYPE